MHTHLKNKIHVKKGDMVRVIAGDDKGKIGKVIKIIRKKQKIIVEKINLKTKHKQPKNDTDTGQIIKFEAPIHSSNVMLYSQEKKIHSRYNTVLSSRGNKKHRVLKKTQETIN